MAYDLSILIPARNEMFTARTVEDILKNKRGKTEVIVGMDGDWIDPGIEDHPDVRILYVSESLGQRKMTNQLARLSQAKYVMKVDAHCAFDEGFDAKLMADMQDNWTVVPTMKNLHVFDWVCPDGHRRYQGPSGPCRECGKETHRDILWRAKPSPNSTSYRFDKSLKFQYFGEYKAKQEGDLVESMSLQGSCFMLTRDKYWQLNICDEKAGSWGHQGSEVALKTWLSGGRVIVNTKTWYAHMFRTQGGDFGFPWPAKENEIEKARQHIRDTFLNDQWPLAKHKLQWLVDKFGPVPDWHDANKASDTKDTSDTKARSGPSKGIIYYTDNRLNLKIAHRVQKQLRKISEDKHLPIVSASLKPMNKMGKNIHINAKRGYLTMFKQILAALEASDADIIFHCEHDVLYHPSHFDFVPPEKNKFYYNHNFWRIGKDNLAVSWDANQVSQLCAYREHLVDYYRGRIQEIETEGFNRSYEPGGRDPAQYEAWKSEYPNVDIRGSWNMTKSKWSLDDFRDKSTAQNFTQSTIDKIPGWENLGQIIDSFKPK